MFFLACINPSLQLFKLGTKNRFHRINPPFHLPFQKINSWNNQIQGHLHIFEGYPKPLSGISQSLKAMKHPSRKCLYEAGRGRKSPQTIIWTFNQVQLNFWGCCEERFSIHERITNVVGQGTYYTMIHFCYILLQPKQPYVTFKGSFKHPKSFMPRARWKAKIQHCHLKATKRLWWQSREDNMLYTIEENHFSNWGT
jgi:hypothetical protein